MNCKLAVVIGILCILGTGAEQAFLLTCPRALEKESTNYCRLQLYDVAAAGKIKIEVYTKEYEKNDTLISEQEYEILSGTEETDLAVIVPKGETYSGKLVINGSFEDGYTIQGEETIELRNSNEKLIFVQTDKPLYKPGQEVMFRILLVDRRLTPLGGDMLGDIWIEDPNRSRMAQWKGVPLGNGIKQLQFQLSEEPNLGTWTINLKIDDIIQTAQFEVKEYVLPKYEVVIKPPPYVLATDELFPLEICAKYTYGKGVEGTLKLNVSLEYYSWSREKYPVIEHESKLDGCYSYMVNVSLIETESYYSYRRIFISVSVIEDGTGVVQNETKYVDRTLSPLNIQFLQNDQRQFYKPGLHYNGKLKLTNPDNSKAANEPIEICSTITRERVLYGWWASKKFKLCNNYTSNADGYVEFVIPPQNTDSVSMYLEAKALRFDTESSGPVKVTMNQPQTSLSLRPWFSPSGSHMQLQSASEDFACDQIAPIKVLFTSNDKQGNYKFFYQINVRGKVISSGSLDREFSIEDDVSARYNKNLINQTKVQLVPGPEFPIPPEEDCPSAREARYVPPIYDLDIEVPITPEMSPSFRFLVYYIRDDRETVADSQKFTVEKCFKNKVDFEFGDELKQPGTRTSLLVKASPNSLCGVRVVDKSISLMESSNKLTKEEVFRVLESTDQGLYYSINRCNNQVKQPGLQPKSNAYFMPMPPRPPPSLWSSSPYEDALTAFEVFGYLVISDLVLMSRPCKSNGISFDRYGGSGGGGYDMRVRGGAYRPVALASVAKRPGPAPHPPSNAFASTRVPSADAKMGMEMAKSAVEVRNYFPETWLFKMEVVGSSGELAWKETLPHTITEWLGSALCVESQNGLGLSEETGIKGFQSFFISLNLPYSIVRGEKVTIAAKIFNYLKQNLPISVSLDDATGFKVMGSQSMDMCIQGDKSEVFPIQLEAASLGKLNLSISAGSKPGICGEEESDAVVARDALSQSIIVEPEGFPQEDVASVLFCPKDTESGMFDKDIILELPEDLVADSARAFLVITGDIMGPAIDNLDQLVVMPTGCGEQNMVRFTPNVFVLEYLTAIGKLSNELKNKAINNLNKGYQRQMKYRHADGSYSAFGVSDKEGSMILTAFVLRSFAQADKYITIDYENFAQTLNWIISKQLVDGCIPEVGRTVGSGLKGGMGSQKGTITAYVLSSLIIAGLKNETIINSALECIVNDEENMSPYKASLYAYTATLAEKPDMVAKYMKILNARSIEEAGETHYKNINGSRSLDIQTAAYAVMTILKSGRDIKEALPIVRWMSKNRNSRGGFVSTQDTVLGLEALGEFAAKISTDPVNLQVIVSKDMEKQVAITEDDKILVREYKVPNVPSSLNIQAEGSGCGLIQTVLRYNTISPPREISFNLNAGSECSDDRCQTATVHLCTSYIPEGKKSNMAVVEVKMLSGMEPLADSLLKLSQDKNLGLMRYDVENNNVFFYFYELTNEPKCFAFEVEEVVTFEDRQPAPVKVYDYYAKEKSATTGYSIGDCEGAICSKNTDL